LWRCNVAGVVPITEDMRYSRALNGYYEDLWAIVRGVVVKALGGEEAPDLVDALAREVAKELRGAPRVSELYSLACIDFDEGLVFILDIVGSRYGAVLHITFCNVNDLTCVKDFVGFADEVLIAPVLARVARRMAGSGEYSGLTGRLERVAGYVEDVLAPLLGLVKGGEAGLEDAVRAARRLAEHPYAFWHLPKLLQSIASMLGREDGDRLREMVWRTVEASKLAEQTDPLGLRKLVLLIRRDARSSVAGEIAGWICIVEYPSYKRPHELEDEEISTDCKLFKNRELLDITAETIKKLGIPEGMFSTNRIASLVDVVRPFDEPHLFEGFTREDLFKLVKATLEAVVESEKRGGIASTTAQLSGGRKLHVIVHSPIDIRFKFLDAILILSNIEIKVTYMETFMKTKKFEDNEQAIKHITEIIDKDAEKLDDETIDAILELLVQRAFMESVTRT